MSTQRIARPSAQRGGFVLLVLGFAALLAAAMVTPEFLGRLSGHGTVSVPLVERLQWLRLTALITGAVLTVAGAWRSGGRRFGSLMLGLSVAWVLFMMNRIFPDNLLLQPARLARAALGEEMLLSDYDPRAHLVVPAHEVLRAKYPVINIHAHFRRWYQHWTPEQLVAFMQETNTERIIDLDGGLGNDLQQEVNRYAAPRPNQFVIFATFWFSDSLTDWNYFRRTVEERLPEAKANGAKGIKIWKNLGLRTRDEHGRLIAVNDPRLDPLWTKAGELSLPILIHVGDPAAFFDPIDRHNERYEELKANPDWSFYGPQYPSLQTVLNQFERVASAHPQTTFILAHLGNRTDDLTAAGAMLDRNPNLFMDISARVSELGRQPRAARAFFIRYQDRLLFGTDGNPEPSVYRTFFRFLETSDEYFVYPFWPEFNYGRWKIYGVNLPDDVLRKLYHDNAAKLLGLPLLASPQASQSESRRTMERVR